MTNTDKSEKENTYFEIVRRLIQLREERRLTKKDAAKDLGIQYPTYQKFETGVSKPNTLNLKKIIDYYGCSIGWLLAGEGTPYPDQPQDRPEEITELPRDLPPGSFDRFMEEVKKSNELEYTISELITSTRQGGLDFVLFRIITDVVMECLNKDKLDSNDFSVVGIIQTIYRELKRTPTKEELAPLITALRALGKIFPYGVPLTPHEQITLFSWGRLPAPEDGAGNKEESV